MDDRVHRSFIAARQDECIDPGRRGAPGPAGGQPVRRSTGESPNGPDNHQAPQEIRRESMATNENILPLDGDIRPLDNHASVADIN
ncbi:hypothetical protein, partial [Streptomyces katrae]|uniref:hypothetical protein n=1 Tax=Streptomyces katrae TaxID=68223 RepID=UPI001B80AEF9